MESSKQIYIIEHADKMNVQAANSLLKFLEEPKGEVVALLLTERPNKILSTIKSRWQVIPFSSLPPKQLINRFLDGEVSIDLAKAMASITKDYARVLEY